MTQEEKIYFVNTKLRWLELLQKGYTKTELALLAGKNRKTLGRWHKRYRDYGENGLVPQSKRPHSCPRQTKAETVKLIKYLRFSRARPLGPIPISIKLKKYYGVIIHWQTVAKVLRRERLVLKNTRTRRKESLPRYSVSFAGEIVEIDVKYASKINDRWTYQYTATDCFTRMRCVETYPEQTNDIAVKFLTLAISRFPFQVKAVKTDNHSTFTNRYTGYAKSTDPLNPRIHAFDLACREHDITHYLIDKGKPQQNGRVERSHRTDNEELYEVENFTSLAELRGKQKEWLRYYNYEREHQGIDNLTPFEKYQQYANITKAE